MTTFLLPSDDETTITLHFSGDQKEVTVDIIDLDILQTKIKTITHGTDNFYPMFITEFTKEHSISLTKGQVYALLLKKRKMFEELKKNYSLLEDESSDME